MRIVNAQCRKSTLAPWLAILCLGTSAQAAMLTSSVSAATFPPQGRFVSGTSSCADSSVPAACSFSGTLLITFGGALGSVQGSASAVPSLYAIDLAADITGLTDHPHALAEAAVATEFLITGVTGSGFVQYVVGGQANVASDLPPVEFWVRHGGLPKEYYGFSPPSWSFPLSGAFTSQLYPVQFGDPFAFSWAAVMNVQGSGGDQPRDHYMRLRLEILVLDAQQHPLVDARLSEVPEPAGFGLLLTGLSAMGLARRPRAWLRAVTSSRERKPK